MAENSDVFVRFGADIDPLKRDLKTATDRLDQFGKKARSTVNQMGKIGVAAVAAAAAIGGKFVANSLSAIDAQAKLARQLGTSSASMAILDRAAEMSGISLKSIESGAKNLEVVMGEAAQGTGAAADTLERLGLTARDLEGLTLDKKILAINAAIAENIPKTQQAAAASDLFGKKAGFAIRQLTEGGIKEATRQMEGFGLTISDFDASRVEAANDAMSSIGRATDGVVQQFTIQLAPILGKIATGFQEAAIESGGFKEQATAAINGITSAVGFLGNAFRGIEVIVKGLEFAFFGLKTGVLFVLEGIAKGVDFVVNSALGSLNELIDGLNNIPGVEIDKLFVGVSKSTKQLVEWRESSVEQVALAAAEMHALLMQPLPSETITGFVDSLISPEAVEAQKAQIEAFKANDEAYANERMTREESVQSSLAQIRKSWGSQQTSAVGQLFGNLSSLMQSGNKRMFEIGKTAAKAQTIVSTYEGAQKAYSALAGIPIIGPGLGAAAAAAAVVAGGVRLQAINSTSFGGGSVNASAAGGGGAPAAAATQAPAQPEQQRTVRFDTLDPSALVTGAMVNSVAEQLVELQNDGFTLVA